MSGIYSTNKIKNLNQLNDVNITDVSNNDIIQYNASSGLWENKTELVTGDITCNDLQVLGTCNVDGEFSTDGLTKLFNNRYIFGADAEFEGNFIVDTAQNTLYVDTINHRVGINKVPEEDFDVDGNIQINTNGTEKITFYDNGHDHEHGKLLFTTDGTDGAEFEVHTLTDGGSVTQKLTINNAGAIGLGATPSYGTAGSVLTSNGSGSAPTWNEPYYFSATSNGANFGQFRITTLDDTRLPLLHNPALGGGGAWTTTLETSGKNQFDETTAQWTCPKTGIYNITIRTRFFIDPFPDGNIGEVYLFLYKDTGSGFTTRMADSVRVDETESGTDPITNISLQITGLFSLNQGDKVRPEVMKKSDDTQQLKCGTSDYDPQFSIHRIA